MLDTLSLRENKSFGGDRARLPDVVEIMSRMGGRGAEHETRHDVNCGEEACYLRTVFSVEYRLVCVYPRA